MPVDPFWFGSSVLEEVRHGLVALLDVNAPRKRKLVALPIAEQEARRAKSFIGGSRSKSAVTCMPKIHKPSGISIAEHAKRCSAWRSSPQFEHRGTIKPIKQAAQFLGGTRLHLFSIELERNHLCAITFEFSRLVGAAGRGRLQ